MKLRLECYDGERDAALDAVRRSFKVRKISKAYPNARQTGTGGTPCESRYYIDTDGVACAQVMDLILADMFRFLKFVTETYGIDPEPEIVKMRAFYDKGGSMPDSQKFELLSEWRCALLGRCLQKGGAAHAAGNR